MAKRKTNWIAEATASNKGALRLTLGAKEGKPIPARKLEAAAEGNYGEKAARRARLAQTLKRLNKNK